MRGVERDHIVIAGPGQWGQQAADHLLNRAVVSGGEITFIVPRRNEQAFQSDAPTYKAWSNYPSVKDCIDALKLSGKPIRYIYDDHLNHLAAELIEQRNNEFWRTVGYVTSAAEDHFAFAEFLVDYCERVLIEKPISKLWEDVKENGRFELLAKAAEDKGCTLKCAEHYLFRAGVERAWHIEKDDILGLKTFLERHKCCNLTFEFQFCEEADRDRPEERPGAYQDGAILDVLASHGLGPVARFLIPALTKQTINGGKEGGGTGRSRILEVRGTSDLRKLRALDDHEHWDHVFTRIQAIEDRPAVFGIYESVGEESDGVNVIGREVLIDENNKKGWLNIRHVQLFTPVGRRAISIEPLTSAPNAINLSKSSAIVFNTVLPSQSVESSVTLRIELFEACPF